MRENPVLLNARSLPVGESFFPDLAHALLKAHATSAENAKDLSGVLCLVPALPVAHEWRQALLQAANGAILLPQFDTLPHWAHSTALVSSANLPAVLANSERQVLLYAALRQQNWFDESALWGIAAEMGALFDELSSAALSLPEDQAALAEQLARAYALRASEPLAFEARVVHELWRALHSDGRLDALALYHLRLAQLAKISHGPALFVLLDAPPEDALSPAEIDFFAQYAAPAAPKLFYPERRSSDQTPLMQTLTAAWPEASVNTSLNAPLNTPLSQTPGETPSLFDRAQNLREILPYSPLKNRLQLVPTNGREQEAEAAVAQIGAWLRNGLRRIVLIAQDRLSARRVRALLEREGVLLSDETGWKLSTTRAASTLDALLECATGSAQEVYYQDFLDLCQSPFLASVAAEENRKTAVFVLDAAIRSASVKAGCASFTRAVHALKAHSALDKAAALSLLKRLEAATQCFSAPLIKARQATLAGWLNATQQALENLGALDLLSADAAGKVLLELLETRKQELHAQSASFSFSAWRDWLNRELEGASFRDTSIRSTIIVTALNATSLRGFDAALLLGGDATQLSAAPQSVFFNQAVRSELGLRTQHAAANELRHDLELLLAQVPRVMVSWQCEKNDEVNLLAPDLARLSSLHQLAWGDNLHAAPLPARLAAGVDALTAPSITSRAAPRAALSLIPSRVSVSAYATLIACPYHFFSRYLLGLGEIDEVSEAMEKSDYGVFVHSIMETFHRAHPLVSALSPAEAVSALNSCVERVFCSAIEDNFFALAWRMRFEKQLVHYLDWQRQHEAAGWRFAEAETRASLSLALNNGAAFEFYGRLDRIDKMAVAGDTAAEVMLFDYKTQKIASINERLKDDVQLPAYVLLYHAATGIIARAAYLALDDTRVAAIDAGAAQSAEKTALFAQAEAQGARLQQLMNALHQSEKMPANGSEVSCQRCEARGLCRRDYV